MTVEELKVVISANIRPMQEQLNMLASKLKGTQEQTSAIGSKINQIFSNAASHSSTSSKKIIQNDTDVIKSTKSRAATLAAQYRKEGLSKSDAFKKAWNEIERTSNAGSQKVKNDLKGVRTEMDHVSKRLQATKGNTQVMANKMNNVFSGFKRAFIALGIGKAIAGAFNLTRTYEASVQQVNRMFGLYSGALESWIEKNAKTFGMARADAMKYASIYGNLVRSFEQDGAKMTQYTTDLIKATTIIASNTGRTVADVSERIRSGILGNTEAIEDLGIYAQVAMLKTTNAFKQIADGRSWEQLTFQEQQQIRVMSILEQTSSQFGDSIQNNMNYQLMQLTATLKNIALNIGQAFMPIVSLVVPILNTMANALEVVTAKLATFMNALFGTNFNAGAGANANASTSQNFTNMGVEAQKAGEEAEKAGKKAKGALMGFDEVNTLNLSKDGGSGSGVSGGNTGGIVETIAPVENKLDTAATTFADRLKAELERLKALFKEGFEIGIGGDWKERLEELKNSIEKIKENLKNIFTDSEAVTAFNSFIDQIVFSIGKEVGSLASIGITIGQNLLGGFNKYLEQNQQFIKDRLIGIFNVSGEIADLVGDFSAAFADIFSVFGGETAQQITANIIGIFNNAFLGVIDLALRFGKDVLDTILGPIMDNAESIKLAIENTLKPVATMTGALKDLITNTFEKIFEAYEQYIEPAFNNIREGFDKIVKAFLNAYNTYLAPTIDKMSKKWSEFYSNTLQPVINKAIDVLSKLGLAFSELYENVIAPFVAWLIDFMGPRVSFVFETISSAFLIVATAITEQVGNLLDAFGGFIDFISGVFKGDWDKAWNGIKDIFKAITDSFESLIKNPINQGLEWIKTTFTSGWRNAWNGVKQIFTGIWDGIASSVRGPMNLIIDAINKVIRGLNKLKIDIPDWVPGFGGESWGISIPSIPRLARGGIVDGTTFMGNYIAGEAGKEMIVPLENTSFVNKLASALGNAVMQAMQFAVPQNDYSNQPLVLEIDGKEIARVMARPLQREYNRLGVVMK